MTHEIEKELPELIDRIKAIGAREERERIVKLLSRKEDCPKYLKKKCTSFDCVSCWNNYLFGNSND